MWCMYICLYKYLFGWLLVISHHCSYNLLYNLLNLNVALFCCCYLHTILTINIHLRQKHGYASVAFDLVPILLRKTRFCRERKVQVQTVEDAGLGVWCPRLCWSRRTKCNRSPGPRRAAADVVSPWMLGCPSHVHSNNPDVAKTKRTRRDLEENLYFASCMEERLRIEQIQC